jgi:tetratricopeptide (TPR) repeat protein
MPAIHPRLRTARAVTAGLGAAVALALVHWPAAQAQTPRQKPSDPVAEAPATSAATGPVINNSALDAQLFYQLLIGEIELKAGSPGTAYEVVLDAARKKGDEQLFKRAADIAVQSRAGEQALAAAQSWRSAVPMSIDAHRYVIQLLVALGKVAETAEPLRSLIHQTPEAERPGLINSLPRFFASTSDRKLVPPLLEEALQPYRQLPATRAAVLQALAGAWLNAQEPERALGLAREAQTLDPSSEMPALVALQLLPSMPASESLVTDYLKARPDNSGMRILYSRVLSGRQRYADAIAQLEAVTRAEPQRASAWLTLGALQLELRLSKEATRSIETFLNLAPEPKAAAAPEGEDDEGPATAEQARLQAYLMLAQAAEQQGDFKAAEAWLAKVDNPQRALEVQQRRASLLAQQGKMAEARALIRQLPDKEPEAARAKLFAEVQLLRDGKLWQEANDLLTQAGNRFPNDIDLMYEHSMLAEKLGRMDEMERLLRKVIELKPDHHHAHNALGYSLAERNLRLPEAKALIEKALALAPGDPFITDSLGWVEYRLGNTAEALRLLRAAYAARPDTEIGAHLGEVLWVAGQTEEARRIWREARGKDASNDVLRETLARLRANL